MNTCCSRENNILQHSTLNSTVKQATFIDNQREYCLYYLWVQYYQWHLLHTVFCICYFSSEFTILSNVSFETPRIMSSPNASHNNVIVMVPFLFCLNNTRKISLHNAVPSTCLVFLVLTTHYLVQGVLSLSSFIAYFFSFLI